MLRQAQHDSQEEKQYKQKFQKSHPLGGDLEGANPKSK
jgi:hypothetical protein